MGQLFNGLQDLLGGALAFFYDLVPSYGLAIILLTISVNLLLFPLTLKQTRSTRAFQSIQPEVRRIQKELKEKPEEMQKELMRVQREAGATPGGCLLPLIVQMPIWFALFRVLSVTPSEGGLPTPSIHIPVGSALRTAIDAGQTFLGMNLGLKVSEAVALGIGTAIPYLSMLAIMVASQYVQQWHATAGQVRPDNPQAAATQMVTKVMPFFIGFISYNFPAGLVLYWMTGNIFRLLQQVVIFRIDGRPQMPVALEESGSKNGKQQVDEEKRPARPQPGSADRRRRRKRK
ncbi:MAG TPA: YidC/Oxa1 family membrane protein insertase [Acidimicrobiia bacterium]|nr:YidC/Oxa1 family membrane protein insertase [Acidimicrobiia bacterium]